MMAHARPAGSACGVDRGTMECNGSTSNGANVYSEYASMSGTTKRSKVNHKSLPNTDPRVHVNAYGDANNEAAVMNMSVESSATTANGKLRPSVVADDCTSSGTPKKNRKRPPAFRIKTGSLVALRYRPEGNTVKDMDGNLLEELSPKAVVETWIDPIPGYHQGFMIIGCRIRCCFPKSVLLPDGVTSSASSGRIVEGDVVGLVDYEHHATKLYQALRERTPGFIPVDLLIDRSSILPFLECVDNTDIDVSALTENERKRFRYEQIIRGIDKVTVRVNLGISYGSKHCSSEKIGKDNVLVCKWVIRERVAIAPPLGGLSKQEDSQKKLYVGNTFDSHAQQEQNFRWLASRMDSDHTAGRYVGEVISVRPSSESLATVTVRMMKLPESTTRGRLLDQSQLELYELDRTREFQVPVEELVVASRKIRRCAEQDSDFATVSRIYSEERNSWRHQYQGDNADMPVDRLICHRCGVEGSDMFVDHIAITPSAISCSKCLQSCKKFGKSGTFLKACRCQGCASHHALALSEAFKNQPRKFVSRENQQLCAVCCLYCKSGMVCNDCGFTIHKRCAKWIQKVDPGFGTQARFHCRTCHPVKQDSISSDALSAGLLKVKCMNFTDFDLPQAFTSLPCTQPANKPIVALKPRGKIIRRVVRSSSSKSCDDADHKHRRKHDRPKLSNEISKVEQCCQNGFTESCLRLLPYDPVTRSFEGIAKHQIEVTSSRQEVVRNLRSEESTKMEEKKTAVRAARASQRRIMKDVVAFGSSLLELDALTGRESHLRFGRSGIHAWGVFADQEIREGEVIVEYRGEIIGNATAEKREAEYVQAKIGSDYMFRMDGNNVCDATKRGNVARYINASCDPNCYTQIISINNAKRIVIYAKKDIPVGQELCYDYKFPVEFDEAKRVACYCGAKDCREFMNWDKRYVSVAAPTGAGTEPTSSAPRSSNHHRAPEVGLDALSDRKA